MPDDIDNPQPLPENPATVADLLPHLPLPYAYAKQYACVFSAELADRLVEIQQANPIQFRVTPLALTDGRYMIRTAILSDMSRNNQIGDISPERVAQPNISHHRCGAPYAVVESR